MKDILDIHTHTLASGHAYNTIMEMARAASDKGLSILGITEHAPTLPGTCNELYFANLHVFPRELYGIRLMLGCELNILNEDGEVDLPEGILKKMDICIASIHPPCFFPKGVIQGEEAANVIEANTNAVINAMKNPYVRIIGHPDDGRFPMDYERVVMAAKMYHVLLELNNSSVAPGGFRQNAEENIFTMLGICKEQSVPVIMSSDAHCFSETGNHCYVEAMIKKINFPQELVVNYSINSFEDYINKNAITVHS